MLEQQIDSRKAWACAVALAMLTLGCEAKPTNDYTYGAKDAGPPPPVVDSGTMAPGEGGAGCEVDCEKRACSTPADPALGSISGEVKVKDGLKPGASFEATGDLYVLLASEFDLTACPGDDDAVPPVAVAVVHCADMRAGKSVPFTIEGVPLRDEPWVVIPFLDVNVDETPGAVALDTCDLLSFPSMAVVKSASKVTLPKPLELGLSGSALMGQCMLPACEG